MEKNVIIAEIRLYIPSSITAPDLDMAAITRPQTASTRAPTIDILSAFSSMRPCALITQLQQLRFNAITHRPFASLIRAAENTKFVSLIVFR